MEDEIEVGEYVRTDKGYIVKIDKKKKNLQMLKFLDVEYGNILKHSKNVIDLIEKGDYVNGQKIKRINDYGDFKRADFNLDYDDCDAVYEDDIKSIVTKEQFASMEYKVKE